MLRKITFLLLLIPSIFFAQESIFYHYGIDEGLSQESIQTLIKDSSGFIWLGTQEGLNRFDGHSFEIYKNDFETPNSICGNDVEKLLEFENYIFIGTKNDGICYYDKTTNNFFKLNIKGTCTALAKHNNTIYASILNDGLYKINKTSNSFSFKKITNLPYKNITSIYSYQNNLFLGTRLGKICILDKTDSIIEEKQISNKAINTFWKENDTFWIGTNTGLYNYNVNTKKKYFISLNTSSPIKINKIIKHNSNYFIATNSGLYLLKNYDKIQHKFAEITVFIGDKNNLNSITSNRVYDILLYNNMLWIGTNKLDVMPLQKPVFSAITTKSKPNISNNHIYATLKTDDYLFVGTRNGLNCIDNNGITHTLLTSNSKIAGNVIRGITKDSANNLWLATTKGISVFNLTNFNPKKPIITSFFHDNAKPTSLSNNNTRSVFEDHLKNIWIATYGGGINLFTGDLNSKIFTFKHFTNNENKNSICSNFTFNIKQTSDNSYWISTENGLSKLVIFANSSQLYIFTNYQKNDTNNSLKSNGVLSTHLDKKYLNILWIATETGLQKLDILQDKFTYYGTKNGLTNLVVYNILEDKNFDLWLSTNAGLFRFNKKTEHFSNYTVNDGLKNIEYNLGANYYDSKDERLYFGGTRGLDIFNINDLEKLYHEGNLFFTSLIIKEKEINASKDSKILKDNISKVKNINLKYNDFPAKLKFADLDFNFPKSSEFVYKLLPNDIEWNPLKNQKEIQFLNLNSGEYKLLIQGKGKEKLWSKKPLELDILVLPPWYKSNVALLIYSVLFLSSIFFLYRFQLQRSLELKETARLKELNELKTKLYSNITHEFRTPLTVILGITDSISDNLTSSPAKLKSYLDMIKRNSNNLLELVNQILDLSKIEKGKIKLKLETDDIVKHLKYLTESLSSYAEEKKISIIFYNEINKLIIPFDKDKINKIVSNLLSNAIKFSSEHSKIIVYLKKQDSNLIIQVKDQGLGIPKDNIPFIFDRFYQATNHKNNTGTGIGLALTKDLVTLMNGTIMVKSNENVETIFTVKIPIIESNTTPSNASIKKENISIIDVEKPIALIVEDNKDVRTYIQLCIEKNYQTVLAKNGLEGIKLAFKHTPDIIISDVMMPIVDGYKLCKTLKEDIKTSHIPIILLTAKNSQESKIEGLIQGADAYLTKPFNKEELLIRINKLIAVRTLLQSKYKDLDKINLKEDTIDPNALFIQKTVALIQENIENSDYHAKDLAEQMNISESQLYRKLKAITTYSTAIFIRKIKLQTAKKLLETTDKSVSEICYETGFNNPSWFSKAFKQEFGFAPSNQRN